MLADWMSQKLPPTAMRTRAGLRSRVKVQIIFAVVLMAVLGPMAAIAVGSRDRASARSSTSTSGGTGLTGGGSTTTSTSTTPAASGGSTGVASIAVPKGNPFAHRAMWIWELPSTSGGNIARIITEAKLYGVRTLIIKSGDGTGMWSQFNQTLVRRLHAAKLKVCGWQYVYGAHPGYEANVGADAVKDGADCLVIDAESQYEGRYVQAQTYMTDLRKQIGAKFPLSLAGFPYVDYHPSFPYSVFLGRGGAQYNTPQMYWQDIGVSVPTVYAHTYQWNTIYRRPIYPLGQMFDRPPVTQIAQFNEYARLYGAKGVSWWVWQSATVPELASIVKRSGKPKGFTPYRTPPTLARGKKGDFVVWAQEHLAAWAARNETGSLASLAIDGDFGPSTQTVIENFQTARGLPVTGKLDAATWTKLLAITPVRVTWIQTKKGGLSATVARAAVAKRGGVEHLSVPISAKLRPKHTELHHDFGQGGRG